MEVPPQDLGIGSWPWRRTRMNPHKVALRLGERSLTYAELAQRVDALAAGLGAAGVAPGARLAYLGLSDLATFELLFASGRLGAIFVPLNYRLAPAEIHALLADCTPDVLVHGPEHTDLAAAAEPATAGVRVLAAAGSASYESLFGGETFAGRAVALEDDAVILYTSGTTGRPKGAVLTHANLTFNTVNQLLHVDMLERDVVCSTAPLFHAAGLGQVTLPAFAKGATVVVSPRFDPAWMLEAIGRLDITAFSAVPTMLKVLCEHPGFAAADLSSLRYVIFGGSPVLEHVARAWQQRGVAVLQGYGMTEASPGVYLALAEGAFERPASTGVPHFFTDVAMRDPQGAMRPVAGEGELLVRGPHVFRGYWDRPGESAAALDGGWFSSGDVLRVGEDGWASVVDRLKDLFISGGENVYPAEVEAAISQLPEVLDSAVVGVPDERWGECGFAFVVLRAGAALDAAALRAALASKLAGFKVPAHVAFVEDLPRTATGKARRGELRRIAAEISAAGSAAPDRTAPGRTVPAATTATAGTTATEKESP
jgi:fatty-acyl-CoA synthase